MQVIDQINGSGLFAQSSNSASIATKDSLGRDITATYLTGIDLSNYYTKNETSGAEQLAQAFADIPVGDPEVNAYVTNHSASLNGTTDLVQNSSGLWNDVAVYQSNSANYLTAINIPESATWNDVSTTVQTNSAQWAEGALPDYEYTDDGLVSAIGSSGLYSTSAGTATYTNGVLSNGTLGDNLTWSSTEHKMVLNPTKTQFGTTTGIFKYLTYATGACISYGSYSSTTSNNQWFGGYLKGNEWMISNAVQGFAMLAGFNRGNVYLSGVRTDGEDFNLCQYSVSGNNSSGSWKYGNEEDTLLRSLSSQIAYLSGVIDQYHS